MRCAAVAIAQQVAASLHIAVAVSTHGVLGLQNKGSKLT
jgi:hypothetical protein